MYQGKDAYFLVNRTKKGKLIDYVGTMFKCDAAAIRKDYELEEAELMTEANFKALYPEAYKKMFQGENWHWYIYTFLKSLPFLDYEDEVSFDEDNEVFYASWFMLQKDDNEDKLVLNHHVLADARKAHALINELDEYLKDLIELHVNPHSYISIQEQGRWFYGQQAFNRYLAENMHIMGIMN